MTPEQKRALAGLLRRFAEMMADRRALITILREAALDERCPHLWQSDLAHLRESDEYRAILAEYESMSSRLEQGADVDEVIPLIQKWFEGKPPN